MKRYKNFMPISVRALLAAAVCVTALAVSAQNAGP
jgi:hypothetical protein